MPPAGSRGFGILLSWQPRVYLSVDAVYDVFYDLTPAGVHRRDLNAVHLHDVVIDDWSRPAMLDQAAGMRYLTEVTCPGDPHLYLHEDVILVRNREIYRVHLQTQPESYRDDLGLIEQLLRSWRWLVPPTTPVAAAPVAVPPPGR